MNSPPAQYKKSRHSFSRNLLRSHMLIAAIGAFSLLIGLITIFAQTRNMHLLSNHSIPISRASSVVLHGIQHSLASMRGWVSLNDEKFIRDWVQVWDDEINPAVINLGQIGSEMNLPGFNQRMTELSLLLAELKESQWWVLEIAQTPGNEPAKVKYQFGAEPILSSLEEIIRSLFDTNDEGLTVFPHDGESNNLHDAGISFYTARGTLDRIVFQGEIELEEKYFYNLHILKTAVSALSHSFQTNDELKTTIRYFNREIEALSTVSTEIIALRKSFNWNVVRHIMETETVPLAKKVTKVMKKLNSDTENLMTQHATMTVRIGKFATLGLSVLLVAMVFAAFIISRKRALALAHPLIILATAANQVAAGDFSEDISPVSDDELGDLTRSFNSMRRDLRDTQKQMVLQEKLAAIGKLSGSVAHDIRNPLNAISNSIYFLNLISNEETDEKMKEHLLLMEHEIHRANGIINDLLDFSRENVATFSKGDVNLLLQQVSEGRDFSDVITVDLQLESDLPLVEFDHLQLERVFTNLISNGAQAMPDGGILKVHSARDGASVRITISDTGHGIAKENLEEIFEPLFTTKASGIGLGLSIVKGFIEKHHGRIDVESEVGKGTTFTVLLPLCQNAEKE